MSHLLEYKVATLKLTLSVRRMISETEDQGMAVDLATLLAAWDDAHQR